MDEIDKVKSAIERGILAEPKFDNIELQTEILQQKGYKGISYVTEVGKIVSVLEDGTVKVYSSAGQLMEEYPELLGGEEKNE